MSKEPIIINEPTQTSAKLNNLVAYEEYINTQQQEPQTTKTDAYNTLSAEQKQKLADAENTIYQVTRRSKIVLEQEQRTQERDLAQGIEENIINKPFKPTRTEIMSKFQQIITPQEQQTINEGLVAKQTLIQSYRELRSVEGLEGVSV